MKKLNRKGFTLVELLAVIIILAIVVGITIPAVLTTISNTRNKAAQSAVDSVADWIDRQYQASLVGDNDVAKVDAIWSGKCTDTTTEGRIGCAIDADLLNAAGVKATNFSIDDDNDKIYIMISTGRSCVQLTTNSDGDYNKSEQITGGIC